MSLFPPKSKYELLVWMFVQLEGWLKDKAKRIEKEGKDSAAAALNEWFQTPTGKAWLAKQRPAGGKFKVVVRRWPCKPFPDRRSEVVITYDVDLYLKSGKNEAALIETFWAN
jgi:hypothetical protein